jgi:threonine aldolase
MARILEEKLKGVDGIKITQKVESNGVFVIIPEDVAERVRQTWFFYPWNEEISEYRLMTSWDTTEEDIERFVALVKKEIEKI